MSRADLEQLARELAVPVDEVVELWSERAAIREHDGGLARADAERAALDDVRDVYAAMTALADEPRKGPRSTTPATSDGVSTTGRDATG